MEPSASQPSSFLDWVEIKNFKSIKDLRLDCKRVNIFIGKPNVGKSNILEALGMLGAEYYETKFMDGCIRYKRIRDLFHQNNINSVISIESNKSLGILGVKKDEKYLFCIDTSGININQPFNPEELFEYAIDTVKIDNYDEYKIYIQSINKNGIIDNFTNSDISRSISTFVIKYDYYNITEFTEGYMTNLSPIGSNLFQIVDTRENLKNEFGKMFSEQGLSLVLDKENQLFEIQRRDGFYIQKYDYYTIADTFRRFMFYIAAIESNMNSTLVFEEPEVHSFPPYTQDIAHRMIYSESNQFFVSTHSPYLLQTLVENLTDDQLQVFVTYYENYETKAKALTPDELSFVQEYSTDVFFNLDRFIPTSDASVVS